FVCRLLHLKIISLKNPLQIGLCNKAKYEYKIKVINLSFQFLLKCYLFFKINRVLCKLQLFIILKCELL
ncbi:hypothetical protein CAT29_19295, partial [Acinetobacter baumannii]